MSRSLRRFDSRPPVTLGVAVKHFAHLVHLASDLRQRCRENLEINCEAEISHKKHMLTANCSDLQHSLQYGVPIKHWFTSACSSLKNSRLSGLSDISKCSIPLALSQVWAIKNHPATPGTPLSSVVKRRCSPGLAVCVARTFFIAAILQKNIQQRFLWHVLTCLKRANCGDFGIRFLRGNFKSLQQQPTHKIAVQQLWSLVTVCLPQVCYGWLWFLDRLPLQNAMTSHQLASIWNFLAPKQPRPKVHYLT